MKRNLIATAAVAALALFSVPAFASTSDLGVLSDGFSTGGNLGSVYKPNIIKFTIDSSEFLTLSATVSNTSAHLAASDLVLRGATPESAAFVKSNGAWEASFGGYPGVQIAAGSYSFTISPAAITGAHASGAYSLTLTAVPEISTWAMMLGGFAAIGFAGYRRRTVFIPA